MYDGVYVDRYIVGDVDEPKPFNARRLKSLFHGKNRNIP